MYTVFIHYWTYRRAYWKLKVADALSPDFTHVMSCVVRGMDRYESHATELFLFVSLAHVHYTEAGRGPIEFVQSAQGLLFLL